MVSNAFHGIKVSAPVEPQVAVGDVVAICAVDWAICEGQTPRNYNYRIVHGVLYGEVIAYVDGGIAIAPQVFVDGDVRGALVIPLVCIQSIEKLGVS